MSANTISMHRRCLQEIKEMFDICGHREAEFASSGKDSEDTFVECAGFAQKTGFPATIFMGFDKQIAQWVIAGSKINFSPIVKPDNAFIKLHQVALTQQGYKNVSDVAIGSLLALYPLKVQSRDTLCEMNERRRLKHAGVVGPAI